MSKYRVAILRGGLSDEYTVSMLTGASVLENINRNLFEPIDVIIARSGEWIVDGRARLPEHILQASDIVFNALHGAFGEDGTVQRFLERYAIPYTGSGPLASGIAMNKVTTKHCLRDTGIKMAPHVTVSRDSLSSLGQVTENILNTFGPQYIIKPVSSGSSVGTMMVKNPLLLTQALTDALQNFDEVMVEARLEGKEATCGVAERYRNHDFYAFPPIEIVPPPTADFFDTAHKYSGKTEEICPARFDYSTKKEIENVAKIAHRALGLSQYSRSDVIVTHDGVYFLEVNTLPGLTKESLYPKGINAVGGSYCEFITHLLMDSLRGHKTPLNTP